MNTYKLIPLLFISFTFCQFHNVTVDIQYNENDSDYHIKRVLGSLPYGVYALAWFIKYVFDSLPLVGVGVKEWKESSAETTFISYLF